MMVAMLCAWSARSSGGILFSRQPDGYYPLLTAGFRAGHLHARLDPDPRLLALADPYDPRANAPYRVHDLSLFHGKYYLYFGATPVLVLFWPVVAATGWYPTEPCAVDVFCLVGIAAGLALLAAIRRRHFPETPLWLLALAGSCLAFGSSLPLQIGQASFYQVPIACAAALNLLMWGAVYLAWHSRRHPAAWMAAASLLFGLMVGARPNYLLGGVALVVACVGMTRPGRPTPADRCPGFGLQLFLAALLPATACGLGIALYNGLRFGSISEFGVRYQLSGWNSPQLPALFDWGRMQANGADYLLRPGIWLRHFPFFVPVAGLPYGFLRYVPWCWLALAAFLTGGRKEPGGRAERMGLVTAIGTGMAANFFLLLLFIGANDRYMADFTPTWLLLAGLGAFTLAEAISRRPWLRRLVAIMLVAAAALSVLTGLGAFVSVLPDEPAAPASAVSRLIGPWLTNPDGRKAPFPGAMRLRVRFARQPSAVADPLVVTGRRGRGDFLYVQVVDASHLRFGFDHWGVNGFVSPLISASLESVHELVLTMDALQDPTGPSNRPWHGQIGIWMDGRWILAGPGICHPTTAAEIVVGQNLIGGSTTGAVFRGTVLSAEAMGPSDLDRMDRSPPGP
jgi:hypothetical protein